MTYRTDINPHLKVHPTYSETLTDLPEFHRLQFTRLRTFSHYLRIETGRWDRTERDNRICKCGTAVQTEEHVISECPIMADIGTNSGIHVRSLEQFFALDPHTCAAYVYKIFKRLELV